MSKKIIKIPCGDLFIKIFQDKVYLVGGYIRDTFLKRNSNSTPDLLVLNHDYDQIVAKLTPFGKVNTVGRSFAIVKFVRNDQEFDIAIPRRDILKDPQRKDHKNFIIQSDPSVSLPEDLKRRDFTINSIAQNLLSGEIIDPFNGLTDLRKKIIRMTNPDSFSQDPLRVLRAARFAAQLNFKIENEIYEQAKKISLLELSPERICEELFKILLHSPSPARGILEFLKLGVLNQLFKDLYQTALTIQDSFFHPEHDWQGHHTVFAHTLIALDISKKLCSLYAEHFPCEEKKLALMLATLLHDIGKTITTEWEYKNRRLTVVSTFHDSKGVQLAEKILQFLKIETRRHYPLKEVILKLIQNHHRIYELFRRRQEISYKAFTRLIRDTLQEDILLLLLDFADRRSRQPRPLSFKKLDQPALWYLQEKERLKINQKTLQPIIQGRDLIPLGISPSPLMGRYLKQLYELQLEGKFATKKEGLKVFVEEIKNKKG